MIDIDYKCCNSVEAFNGKAFQRSNFNVKLFSHYPRAHNLHKYCGQQQQQKKLALSQPETAETTK